MLNRDHLESVKDKLDINNKKLSSIKENDIRSLIEQTGQLKDAYVLTGNHNLKIARQQYFLDCQQKVGTSLSVRLFGN